MLPFRLVYHSGYDLNFGDHVFPSQKYRMIQDRLRNERFAQAADFLEPEPAPDEDLLAVHERDWIERLSNGTLSFFDILKLEVPYSRQMVRGFRLAAGGTTLASRLALAEGVGFNIGGGFHHAFADHGEGFCAINDPAVAVRRMQREALIRRAMIVDCDVHHGNGTAAIFAGDPSVFTFSIHQFNNYPAQKPASDIDIDLADETGDEEYLEKLRAAYIPAVEQFAPELIVYVAGADPYFQDQLGGLSMTVDGLRARDLLVFSEALQRGIPVSVALAGGYAVDVNDTVTIHANTVKAAHEVLKQVGWKLRS